MSFNNRSRSLTAFVRLVGYLSIFAFPVAWFVRTPETIGQGFTLGVICAISVFVPLVTLSITRSKLSRINHFRQYPDNTITPLEWSTEDRYTGPAGSETFETAIARWPHHSPA